MSDCIYCANPASDHGSGIDSHRFTPRRPEPSADSCAYCAHPVDHHGTTQVGCADCGCGFDSDFHPDPPRGDE